MDAWLVVLIEVMLGLGLVALGFSGYVLSPAPSRRLRRQRAGGAEER